VRRRGPGGKEKKDRGSKLYLPFTPADAIVRGGTATKPQTTGTRRGSVGSTEGGKRRKRLRTKNVEGGSKASKKKAYAKSGGAGIRPKKKVERRQKKNGGRRAGKKKSVKLLPRERGGERENGVRRDTQSDREVNLLTKKVMIKNKRRRESPLKRTQKHRELPKNKRDDLEEWSLNGGRAGSHDRNNKPRFSVSYATQEMHTALRKTTR